MPSGARKEVSLPEYSRLARWTVQDVANWLAENGLTKCIKTMRNSSVDGNKLATITSSQLASMGCPKKEMQKLLDFVNAVNVPGRRANLPAPAAPYGRRSPQPTQQDYDDDDDDSSDGGWAEDEFDDEDTVEPSPQPPPRRGHPDRGHPDPVVPHNRPPPVVSSVPPRVPGHGSRAPAPSPTNRAQHTRAPASLPSSSPATPGLPYRPPRRQPQPEPDDEDYEEPMEPQAEDEYVDPMDGATEEDVYEDPDKPGNIDPSPHRGPLPAVPNGFPPKPKMTPPSVPTSNGVPRRPNVAVPAVPPTQRHQKPAFRAPAPAPAQVPARGPARAPARVPDPSPVQEDIYEEPNADEPEEAPALPPSRPQLPGRKKSVPQVEDQPMYEDTATPPPLPPTTVPHRVGNKTVTDNRKSVGKPSTPPPPPPSSIPSRTGKRPSLPEQETYEVPDLEADTGPQETYEIPDHMNGDDSGPQETYEVPDMDVPDAGSQDVYEDCDNEPSPPPTRRDVPKFPQQRPPPPVQQRLPQPPPPQKEEVYEVPDADNIEGDDYLAMNSEPMEDENYLDMSESQPPPVMKPPTKLSKHQPSARGRRVPSPVEEPLDDYEKPDAKLPPPKRGMPPPPTKGTKDRGQHPSSGLKSTSKQGAQKKESYTDVTITASNKVSIAAPVEPTQAPVTASLSDLSSQKWFHADVQRTEANRKFSEYDVNGMYLIRKSTQGGDQPYTLMIYFNKKVHNLQIKLNRANNCYRLGNNEEEYQSLVSMINTFKTDKIIHLSDGSETKLVSSMPKS